MVDLGVDMMISRGDFVDFIKIKCHLNFKVKKGIFTAKSQEQNASQKTSVSSCSVESYLRK